MKHLPFAVFQYSKQPIKGVFLVANRNFPGNQLTVNEMQIKSTYKNVFLTLLLTRIIRKELIGNRKKFTRSRLESLLKEKDAERATRKVWNFLTLNIDNVQLAFTESSNDNTGTIDFLFTLVESKLIGKNWREFEKIQRAQIKFFPTLKKIVKQFDNVELKKAVKTVLNDQARHKKTLKSLSDPENYGKVPNNSKTLLKDALKHLKEEINLRLEQLYPKECLIGSYSLSEDEIAFIRFFQLLPYGLNGVVNIRKLSTVNEFHLKLLPPALVIKRLLDKGLLYQDKNEHLQWVAHPTNIELPEVTVDYSPLYYSIASNLWEEKIKFFKGVAMYFFQKAGKWQEANNCYNYKDSIKKKGFLHLYIEVLDNQINSKYFLSTLANDSEQLWKYWALSFAYNSIGELEKASTVLEHLFKGIKNTYLVKYKLKEDGVEILIKAFQLGLEILLNYEAQNILLRQTDVFKLFILDFLVPAENLSVPTSRLRELSASLSGFYYKLGEPDYANKLMLNAADIFVNRRTSAAALIFLTLIDTSPLETPINKKLYWAYKAKEVFERSANTMGVAKAELYLAYLRLLQGKENRLGYLKYYINLIRKSACFDRQILEILKNLRERIQDADILNTIVMEIGRLEDIKQRIDLRKFQHLDLTCLLLDFNARNYDLLKDLEESQAKKILLSWLTPTFKKVISLENSELQALITGNDTTKMQYLVKAFALTKETPHLFYQIHLTKAILTREWNPSYIEPLLRKFFSNSSVVQISKFKDFKCRLDYANFLIKHNRLAKAKIILDSFEPINEYYEYYNVIANYYKSSFKKKNAEKNSIIFSNYERAIGLVNIAIEKSEIPKVKLSFLKDKGRYCNNLGLTILETRTFSKFGKAKRYLIESINIMGGYKVFPYPYHGIALLIAIKYYRLSQTKKSKLMDRSLSAFFISNEDKNQIKETAFKMCNELFG